MVICKMVEGIPLTSDHGERCETIHAAFKELKQPLIDIMDKSSKAEAALVCIFFSRVDGSIVHLLIGCYDGQ